MSLRTLRKRVHYAWNAFWMNPDMFESAWMGIQELRGTPPEGDEWYVERMEERLEKLEYYTECVEFDLGIDNLL